MNVTNCSTDVKEKRNYLPPDTKYTKLQPNNILSGIPGKRLSANAWIREGKKSYFYLRVLLIYFSTITIA